MPPFHTDRAQGGIIMDHGKIIASKIIDEGDAERVIDYCRRNNLVVRYSGVHGENSQQPQIGGTSKNVAGSPLAFFRRMKRARKTVFTGHHRQKPFFRRKRRVAALKKSWAAIPFTVPQWRTQPPGHSTRLRN